ncbi:MAG: hypothetical protein IJ496_10790 [Ruminococcus sp.]|nr:hypothetical protein [Ruminococcus sp.]
MDMKELLEEYRKSCNLLTERIDEINQILLVHVPRAEYLFLKARRKVLREERLELLYAMRSLQEYCR